MLSQRLLTTVAFSLFCLIVYYAVVQWDYLNVRTIVVEGNRRLSREAILRQAGIGLGVNLAAVNLHRSEKRLKADPWIADAKVDRQWPNKVRIAVREEAAVAIVELGKAYLINPDGVLFKAWSAGDPPSLPVVSGLAFADVSFDDDTYSIPFNAVLNVLHFGLQSDSILPNRAIRRIRVDRELGLVLEMEPNRDFLEASKIKLGYHNYSVKYERLKTLLDHLKQHRNALRIDSIDLNDPERFVVAPRTDGIALQGAEEGS